jgi:hypoxanthine-DNA glycosylase
MADRFLNIAHPFAPVWDARSRVLVLGTFPSVKSRETAFYYGHPQNRFWRVLATLLQEEVPATIESKRALLLQNGVALWDVLASCDIAGSADGSIRRPIPNDIAQLLSRAPIRHIFTNGQTAAALYRRWCEPQTGVPATALPSTSPANAVWTLPRLTEAWQPLIQASRQE